MRKLLALCAGLVMSVAAAAQTAAPAAPAAAPAPIAGPIIAPAVVPPAEAENIWVLDLSTGGRVTIQLRPDVAPKHVERIKALTREGFYNGTVFHRVIEGFMAQGGDPTATGTGGSKLPDLPAEFSTLPHVRGALAMARSESPNSANSQFFICFMPTLKLDGKYTVFGRVLTGMEYVDAIERGEPPATPTKLVRASMATDKLPPVIQLQPVG